jgi:hypothetical protein
VPPQAALRDGVRHLKTQMHRATSRLLQVRHNGQINFRFSEIVSSPKSKNISLCISVNQNYKSPCLIPEEGRRPSSLYVGMGCGGRGSMACAGVAGRDEPREQLSVHRTSDASTLPSRLRQAAHGLSRGGGGSCVRRSRVGLASVADAKSAEAMSGPTGSASPSIRETTVTKRNSSPGRARRKPLKPFACGNAGLSPVDPW